MRFETARDRLISEGKIFDEETLRELPFRDLDRAWIGDAGAAACSQELVRECSLRRIEDQAWRIIHQRMHPKGPKAIPDPDLWAAALAFIERRPRTPAVWDNLGPIAQTYLLLRQIRNDPGQGTVLRSLALLMSRRVLAWADTHGSDQADELVRFRQDTYELFKIIRSRVPKKEAEVCSHLEVAGYHCSNGCFLPGAVE